MNEEVKKKWVGALRSGNYKQGKGSLRLEDSYCCLGVLCDIMGAEWIPVNYDKHGPTVYNAFYGGEVNSSVIPRTLRDHVGLSAVNPLVRVGEFSRDSLAVLNDNGSSFEEIAQIIEREF